MVRQASDLIDLTKRIDSVKTESKRIKARDIAVTADKYKDSGMWREYLETIFLLAKYFIREGEI